MKNTNYSSQQYRSPLLKMMKGKHLIHQQSMTINIKRRKRPNKNVGEKRGKTETKGGGNVRKDSSCGSGSEVVVTAVVVMEVVVEEVMAGACVSSTSISAHYVAGATYKHNHYTPDETIRTLGAHQLQSGVTHNRLGPSTHSSRALQRKSVPGDAFWVLLRVS